MAVAAAASTPRPSADAAAALGSQPGDSRGRTEAMRFLVVDDHPILRLGVRQLIQAGWPGCEVEEAETIEAACVKALAEPFDAVVLDLVMPDVSGSEGVTRMLALVGKTPILVLSFNAESKSAAHLLQLGVAGYLPKDRAAADLVVALRRIVEGKRFVTEAMADHLLGLLGGAGSSSLLPHESLSTQEYRVMLQLAAGCTPAAIGQAMDISARTVGTYRTRIFEKTGWKSNVELARYCVQQGLVVDSV